MTSVMYLVGNVACVHMLRMDISLGLDIVQPVIAKVNGTQCSQRWPLIQQDGVCDG